MCYPIGMTILPGQLLQYKFEHYGKFYAKLPKVPFEPSCQRLSAYGGSSADRWAALAAGTLTNKYQALDEGNTQKYVLMSAKVVTVPHRRIEIIKCDYILCFISNPYNQGETVDGWVRPEWVEPLNTFGNYSLEQKAEVQKLFKKMMAEKRVG